jgi:hypothetical protein
MRPEGAGAAPSATERREVSASSATTALSLHEVGMDCRLRGNDGF